MISLTRDSLTTLKVDAICYGAKNTGGMGGGAAAAIVKADGPEVLKDAQRVIQPNSQVGDVYLSKTHALEKTLGVKYIVHLVSIIQNTPEGAYCPDAQKLHLGVKSALAEIEKHGCKSIGFSAMGTGEGRVPPDSCARLMLSAATEFNRAQASCNIEIIFALPSYRDYLAFQKFHGQPSL